MSIMTTVKAGFFVAKNVIVKNFPKIAVGVGSISIVAGGIDACRQTLKADAVIEEHRNKLERIHYAMELAENGDSEYPSSERRKDLFTTYMSTAFEFIKLYWRPIALVGLGFASIFGGFGVLNSRYAKTLGAFMTVSEQFTDYRANVVNEYGEEVDRKLLTGVSDDDISTIKVTRHLEDGTEKEFEVAAVDLSEVNTGTFTFDYNWKVPGWDEGNYLFSENNVETAVNEFTRDLRTNKRDFVKASHLAERLGFDRVPENRKKMSMADFYGWVNRPGAEVKVSCIPYVTYFSADEASDQFPMKVPINVLNDDEFEWFREKYIEDPHNVGYDVTFDVDKDENGIPKQIYTTIYGD